MSIFHYALGLDIGTESIVSAGRKSPFGDADKILDQIRLQEVPHVHL